MRQIFVKLVVFALTVLVATKAGASPTAIERIPMDLNRASLTIVGNQGEITYSAEELEEIGFYRVTTVTPWRNEPAAFDGPLLTDLLEMHGLKSAPALRVVAENDYAVVIPSEIWKKWPIVVATRVNGKPHTRRQKGPIQFILPMSHDPRAGGGGQRSLLGLDGGAYRTRDGPLSIPDAPVDQRVCSNGNCDCRCSHFNRYQFELGL